MPTFAFDREATVSAAQQPTWEQVTDVAKMVEWISVLQDAQEHEPLAKYSAVLHDKIGMFSLRADLDIAITDVEPGRRLRARAEGQDRQVGSRIVIDAHLELSGDAGESRVRLHGSYDVTGRVATLGTSAIRRKGDKVLDDFFTNLQRELAAP